MGIPTYIYIPNQAVEDDDASMVSWQSSSGTPKFIITVEVRPLRHGSHQKWKGSKQGCDHAIKMPHRCGSQSMTILEDEEDEDEDESIPRGLHVDLGNVQTVDCKRRHRLSLREEALTSCIGQNKLREVEDESHENDRPPRMPRRYSK